MLRALFLCLLAFCLLPLAAQRSSGTTDVLKIKGGTTVKGKVVEYEYGKGVKMEVADGSIEFFAWDDIRRLSFESTVREALPTDRPPLVIAADRRYSHEVTTLLGGGRGTPGFRDVAQTVYDIGIGYAYLRRVGRFALGAGVNYSIMSQTRRERLATAILIGELPLARGRVQPVIRLEGGVAYPFGNSEIDIVSRKLGSVISPALGLRFRPRDAQRPELLVDLGYRFATARFEAESPSFELIQRRTDYRRFTLRTGVRF